MKIIFEFVGGPLDGKTVLGETGQQDEADRYYVLTHRGRVGQRFRVASKYAIEILAQEELKEEIPHHFQPHRYVVTDRVASDDEVLIRVEYIEHGPEATVAAVREDEVQGPDETEKVTQTIRRTLQATASSLHASYSHCWPVDEGAGDDTAARHVMPHVAHVLLGENLSVFVDAAHPFDQGQSVDLLGVAASQDWFLACHFANLSHAKGMARVLGAVRSLKTFWLSERVTIEACRAHVARVANHCQVGYGMVAGLHRAASVSTTTEILQFWREHSSEDETFTLLSQSLVNLGTEWPAPHLVQSFDRGGAYYLLALFFRIPSKDSMSEAT